MWPIWSSGHIGIFPKKGPYEFSPKLNPTLWSAFGRNTPTIVEIMLDDHLAKIQTFLDYKKGLFGQVAILEFFQMGDPMNLVQN